MLRFVLVSVALLASTACAPQVVYPAGLVLEVVARSSHVELGLADGSEQTTEEAAAEETKRQRENEQVRLTGARLGREREIAKAVGNAGAGDDSVQAPVDPYAPERLDSSAISAAIDSVRSEVMQCKTPGMAGRVVVRIKVAADGHVRTVELERAPERAVGQCVVASVRAAVFTPTRDGGSFRYPFVF
jgi:TonB family protein